MAKTPEKRFLIAEIAEVCHLPKKFLESILLDLKNNGFLGPKIGKGSGYYFIKNPADINVADVYRIFEGAIALYPCATFKYYQACEECLDPQKCGIRKSFLELRNKQVEAMKSISLNDLIQ